MNIEDIEGGVSPLKARQSSRGGKHAGKATAKKGNYLGGRGGYAKSAGARGAGGRNVGGYNVHTRFNPRKQPTAPGSTPTSQKPYKYDKDGNIVINNYIDGKGGTQKQEQSITTGTKTSKNGYWEDYYEYETTSVGSWDYSSGKNPSYKQAWDLNLEDITNKYEKFDDYVQDLEDQKSGKKPKMKGYKRPEYNEDGSTTTKKIKKRRWVELPDSTSTTTTTQQSQSQKTN